MGGNTMKLTIKEAKEIADKGKKSAMAWNLPKSKKPKRK